MPAERQAGSLRDAATETDSPLNANADEDPPTKAAPAGVPRESASRGTAARSPVMAPVTARPETLPPPRTNVVALASSRPHRPAESPRYGTAAVAEADAAPRAGGESVAAAQSERSLPESGFRFGVHRIHEPRIHEPYIQDPRLHDPAMPSARAAREADAALLERAGGSDDIARLLAALLDDEADLRGVER